MTSVQAQPQATLRNAALIGQPVLPARRPLLTAVGAATELPSRPTGPFGGVIAEWLDTVEIPADTEVRLSDLGADCAIAVVEAGGISVHHKSGDGRVLISLVLPGDLVQLSDTAAPLGRTWRDTRIGVLSAESARMLFAERPDAALTLMKAAGAEAGRVRQQYLDLAFRDVSARVAKLLLLLDRVDETRRDPRRVDHGLTQSDMAKIVAASRETVNKALSDFARRGWIVLEERAFWLLDRAGLERRVR